MEKPVVCLCVRLRLRVLMCVSTCACVGIELVPGPVFALSKEVRFQDWNWTESWSCVLLKRFRDSVLAVAVTARCYITVRFRSP